MLNKLNKCDIYILLWAIYYSQGVLYAKGSIISRSVLLLIVLWSFYHFMKLLFLRQGPYMRNMKILLVYQLLLGLGLVLSRNVVKYWFLSDSVVPNWYYLKYLVIQWFPIFTFAYFCKIGLVNDKKMRIYALAFFIIALISFYSNYLSGLTEDIVDVDGSTNNAAYLFLSLIPYTFLFREKKITQYIILIVLFFMLLICMKRGALIIGIPAILIYIYYLLKEYPRTNKIAILAGALAFAVVLVFVSSKIYSSSMYLQQRVLDTLEGNYSGRDVIYTKAIDYLKNRADNFHLLFGGGAYYSIEVLGIEAHNDWLEMAINGGLVGILIYLFYWVGFYKQWKYSRPYGYCRGIMGMCLFIAFSETLFSMSSIPVSMSLILAYSMHMTINDR